MNMLNLRNEASHEYVRLAVRCVNFTLKKKDLGKIYEFERQGLKNLWRLVRSPRQRAEREREKQRQRDTQDQA